MIKVEDHQSAFNAAFQGADLHFLGAVGLGPDPEFDHFSQWLADGLHAQMQYLENYREIRERPALLLDGAQSALAFCLPYSHLSKRHDPIRGPRIAAYARMRDYHRTLRSAGEHAYKELQHTVPELQNTNHRVVVDSAPLIERSHAQRASGGFIGKNTCLILPNTGSCILLGFIITTGAVTQGPKPIIDPSRRTAQGGCGSCRRCQSHCPTGALDAAYRLNAHKCLSYWTIENRGIIPVKFWPALARYWYGCDICQDVCPYNRLEPKARPSHQRFVDIPLERVATMDQALYEQLFGGTALTRAKISGLRRNALIALIVTDHPETDRAIAWHNEFGDQLSRDTIAQIPEYHESLRDPR